MSPHRKRGRGAVRKYQLRFRAGWDGHVDAAMIVISELPRDLDATVGRIVVCSCLGDAAARARRNPKAPIAGLQDPEAGDIAVQERDDRALAVVVERRMGSTVY